MMKKVEELHLQENTKFAGHVPAEDVSDFAHRIRSDDGVREEMGKTSLQKAESFSSDAFAFSVMQLYEKTVKEE